MEVYGFGIKISGNIPPNIVTKMIFMTMEVLQCMQVMEDVDIGLLRPATFPLV